MKNIIFILVSFLLIFLFSKCKKEKVDELVNRPDYIVIDTNELSDIHTYNPFINVNSPFDDLDTFDIDIDGDNVNDIQFVYYSFCTRTGCEGYSKIRCLHDSVSIETFVHIDTIVTFQTFESDTLLTINTSNYSSSNEYTDIQNLQIDSTLCPVIHNNSDTIDGSLEWRSGSFIFSSRNSMSCGLGIEANWPCYPQLRKNYHHGAWKDIENRFVAIKMNIKNEDWYSWIQIDFMYGLSVYRYRRI